MNRTFEITIRDKIARYDGDQEYVCGNSDFVVRFDFDEEWSAYPNKTARFVSGSKYQDVIFSGNECSMPIISNAYNVKVGVFAGELHTTTPAEIQAVRSILCGSGTPVSPSEDVYAQIMEKLNSMGGVTPEQVAAVVAEYMAQNPIQETDPTVPEWAKSEKKPTYTAEEVGAISLAKLGEATETVLRTAKESGEFDGSPGPAGSDADVTAENIKSALGYTPANQEDMGKTFNKIVEIGSNRFDREAVTAGYYVNPNNGELASNASYQTTDYIAVIAGEIITYQYGTPTVVTGRTIGTMTFLGAYDENKGFVSGERNLTSYTVPEGVAYIRFSATGMLTAMNPAVVASAEKMDYEPYGEQVSYTLKPECHDDDHIKEIVGEVVGDFDFEDNEVWAPPIVEGVTTSRFEIDNPGDQVLQEVLVSEGSTAESIRIWGKNHFRNEKGAAVTAQGVTVEWDAENQEFVFNGTTTSAGDFKLVNPFEIDWEPGKKYTMSVRRVSGTATLGTGTGSTTYGWGVFRSDAAKYIRGATGNTEFLDLYQFTNTAYALDSNKTNILYFQCWRPGTVFENYRVKIQIEKGSTVTDWEPYHGETVAIADAPGQQLYQGVNYILALPAGETVTIGQVVDTKEYVDRNAGIKSIDELPDAVVTNAYDKDSTGIEPGKFLWNGGVSDNAAYFSTRFIAVEPDTDYAFFGSDLQPTVRSICEYDADQTFIAGMSHQNVVTIHTTANTYFVRVSCYNGAEKSLTVRKGTMTTGYTPRNTYKIPGEAVAQDVTVIDAYLPKHIYCAVGRTIELYNNQVCLQADKYHMKWSCPVGKALKRKFSITGTDGLVGDYTLKLGIYNDRLEEVWAGSTMLHIVSSAGKYAGIVPIGDSLTNGKAWLPEVVNLSQTNDGNIEFFGTYSWTRNDADDTSRTGGHEGRSGFTAEAYIKGAVYSYGGETEPNIFWDGEKFSWAHYMAETYYGEMGLVQGVMIFLGTNGISNDNSANAGYIKQMVDTIRADDENIKIFVCNTIYRSNQDGIGVQQSNDGYAAASGVWKYNEDKKVMDLMKRLDAMLDGYENLWMVNLALTHDSEYNFGVGEPTRVNPRAEQHEWLPLESVHPQDQGYYQMADTMFSVICAAYS